MMDNYYYKQVHDNNRIRQMVKRISKLEAVARAARALSDSIEQGFSATLRPDIARANLNELLEKLENEKNKI